MKQKNKLEIRDSRGTETTTKDKSAGKVTCFSHPSPLIPTLSKLPKLLLTQILYLHCICIDIFNIGFREKGYKKRRARLKLS